MADSSDIDAALVALLQADAQLQAVMTDGVFFGEAPPGLRQFVIVDLVIELDIAVLPGVRAIEDALYLVKGVSLGTSGSAVKTAAARIDALLEDQPLTVAGYGWMTMHREERVREIEVDDIDAAIRWQHRGGRYRVQMATNAAGAAS